MNNRDADKLWEYFKEFTEKLEKFGFVFKCPEWKLHNCETIGLTFDARLRVTKEPKYNVVDPDDPFEQHINSELGELKGFKPCNDAFMLKKLPFKKRESYMGLGRLRAFVNFMEDIEKALGLFTNLEALDDLRCICNHPDDFRYIHFVHWLFDKAHQNGFSEIRIPDFNHVQDDVLEAFLVGPRNHFDRSPDDKNKTINMIFWPPSAMFEICKDAVYRA